MRQPLETLGEIWRGQGRAEYIEERNEQLGGLADMFAELGPEGQESVLGKVPDLFREAGSVAAMLPKLKAHIAFFLPEASGAPVVRDREAAEWASGRTDRIALFVQRMEQTLRGAREVSGESRVQ